MDIKTICKNLFAQRLIRFGVVGVAATLSYFLLGLLFVNLLGLPALAGNALAYVLAFVVSYLGQALWTFEAKEGHRTMLPRFALTQLVGLGINSCIVWICLRMGMPYEYAMIAAAALVPVFVYIICKYWVFNKKKS